MSDGAAMLAIHGGAGVMAADAMSGAERAAHRAGLAAALRAGHAVLRTGGAALDAVAAAVCALEDDPLFNAGRGAVFTAAGRQEMDAAVMDGATRAAGAVAGILGPRHPVLAARAVMERSDHVLLAGEGAMAFLREEGLEMMDEAWFATDRRRDALRAELQRRRAGGPPPDDAARHGTVGAVARDAAGRLAAATSTGGMTAKRPGRVGDTPVIGAGTWADEACAVSATGHGEVFIRWAAAHEVAARVRLGGEALEGAAAAVVAELARHDGSGGLIAVDARGRVALPFNCGGMYRGTIGADGVPRVAIHAEPLAPADATV